MSGCPFHPGSANDHSSGHPIGHATGRRGLLKGAGVAAGLAAAHGVVPVARAAEPPSGGDPARQAQAFFGAHQSGVTTPRQAVALLVAFDVLAENREDLARLMRRLSQLIAFLMRGGPAPMQDPLLPPPDSGIVGPEILPDNLTITVSVGASLFDRRYGLAERVPRHLAQMPPFPNDALEAERCDGDLLLQICSNTEATNLHALRATIKQFPELAVRWKIRGFVPPRSIRAGPHAETARNLLGFKDGTANPDSGETALMDRIVWVRPGSGEPAWASGGTYQVVRRIRMFVEHWDRTPLHEQQTIIGRDKMAGAPLGKARELDDPDYAADPHGERIPLAAHIRLANPRTPETLGSLILRRPYNYDDGITDAGQLDMGLLFVCFQADLAAGFLTVQGRLNGEPLEEYIKPVGGGFFFTLPGVADGAGFLGDGLLAA
jgi:deferrochelatase/peroxidase EfeB